MARTAALVGAPVLLIGALTWPLLFTNSVFYIDWITHLWFVWQQSLAIRADHVPSFFINYSHSVFDPVYAFYGGTIYTIAGLLSLVLGNAPVAAYVLTYLMAFAAAYGGWYWIGRMTGLGRWQAQVPGAVFITSAFYLQILYASGDWPAFVGVSTLPLVIASALSLMRAERVRMLPAIALVASSIVFFGSHNVTILWGTTTTLLTALAIVIVVPQARQRITRAGVIRVAGLAVPGLLVNAWYLLPTVAYASRTWLGSGEGKGQAYWDGLIREHMPIVSVGHLFTLSQAESFPGAANSSAALPVLAIAWVLLSIPIVLRIGSNGTWLKILLVVSVMATLIGVVMTHAGLLLSLPAPYTKLQYSVRLESFVLLGVAGAVLAVLVLAQGSTGRTRLWTWTLAPVLAVSVVVASERAADFPPAPPGVSRALQMRAYQRLQNAYADADLPVLDRTRSLRELTIAPAAVHDDRVSGVVYLRPGQLVASNIGGGPELVHVAGARIVGIDPGFNDVLEIDPAAGSESGGERITVSTADGFPILAGRLLTIAAAIILVGELAAIAARDVRARRV